METPEMVFTMTSGQIIAKAFPLFFKGRVLDVGCGNKPFKRLFPDCEWVGLDIRPVGEILADAQDMPMEDESFDTVLCVGVLSYVHSPMRVVHECARVLKPGGHLIVMERNTAPDDGRLLWKFSERGVDYLLSSAGMTHIGMLSDGTIISSEWSALNNFEKYNLSTSGEVTGWLEMMNERYKAVSCGVGTKP